MAAYRRHTSATWLVHACVDGKTTTSSDKDDQEADDDDKKNRHDHGNNDTNTDGIFVTGWTNYIWKENLNNIIIINSFLTEIANKELACHQ